MDIKPTYLVMVTGENNNKYYKMTPQGNTFSVEFGRIGSGCQTTTYSISAWNKKYDEKIRKGYVDQTHLVSIQQSKPVKDSYKTIDNPSINTIVMQLQAMAKQAIADNYTISSAKVTQAMIDEAQYILNMLVSKRNMYEFNEWLINLFKTIPRKMNKVSDYLASDTKDFSDIIEREQDLLDVMKGQVVQNIIEEEDINDEQQESITILESLQLSFDEVDDIDIVKIKNALGECSNKFTNAWKVKNYKTEDNFIKFVVNEKNIPTKLLWHGSRNENWWSIINTGLVLKPTNAIITGKMFGHGIYFATKARKSLGYTSLSGSYWAGGKSNSAFMGLYNVAYGNPYDAYSFEHRFSSLNFEKLRQMSPTAHCLHAHEGSTMLRNDEIIVYKEEQTTINYLVELKN